MRPGFSFDGPSTQDVPAVVRVLKRLENLWGRIWDTSPKGATMDVVVNEETITLATGATTTDSSANLLPADSVILGVAIRLTTTITTAANWQVGDGTTANRFIAADTHLTAGYTLIGLQHWQGNVATAAAGPVQAAAAKVRITTNANPGAGAIRVTVWAQVFTAPGP